MKVGSLQGESLASCSSGQDTGQSSLEHGLEAGSGAMGGRKEQEESREP